MRNIVKYPSQDYLNAILSYDAGSGALTWVERKDVRGYWNSRYAGKQAGAINLVGYRQISINDRLYLAHRLIWVMRAGEPVDPLWEIDHIDGDRANNSWKNLRVSTRSQNAVNKPAKGSSAGIRGVYKTDSGNFRSAISVNKKYIHIGTFSTAEEARFAYAKAAQMYYGDFARLD